MNANPKQFRINSKELFFLALLFCILYIEPIAIGGLKISQIWKGILVIFLLTFLIKRKLPVYLWIGIVFSLKYMVYTYIPYGIMDALRESLESLIFPLIVGYLIIKFRGRDLDYLIHLAILLSIFILYSSVPFLLGLKSLNPEFDLSKKYELDITATKGLFYHIATASKLFTISTLIIFNLYDRFSKYNWSRLFWLITVLLGSYLVIMSWTRTGWFIYLTAIIISLFYNAPLKKKMIGIVAVLGIGFAVMFLYETNQAFRWRLTGGASYRSEKNLSVDQLASARLPYITVALDNMSEEGAAGIIFGYGEQRGKDLFEKKTNMAITSHNKTFEILESSGLIALVLYFFFIKGLFINVKRNWQRVNIKYKKLAAISMFLFFAFYLTSHGTPLWGEIIYAFIFSYILLSSKADLKNNVVASNTVDV